MKRLTISAKFIGTPRKGLTTGKVYQLVIKNKGARSGEREGPHDWVWIEEAKFGCPYTLRGFLLNWEIVNG